MKKMIVMVLCFVLAISLAGCGEKIVAPQNSIAPPKSEQVIIQENEAEKIIEVCMQYILDNNPKEVISTLTNFDTPSLEIIENLPDLGTYMKISDEEGTAPFYIVTFNTTADDMIGPIKFIINQEIQIVGTSYRE